MASQQSETHPARLDLGNQAIARDGERVQLAPKAFAVLDHLRVHAGQLVTKDELLGAVWPSVFVGDAVLKVAVRELRQALKDDARAPRYIETVHRRGYRLIGKLPLTDPNAASGAAAPSTGLIPPAVSDLVGRTSELAALDRCWEQAAVEGRRQIVLISGEPGIGKSMLLQSWLQSLDGERGRELLYARGQCLEQHGASEAYLPILEAFGRLCSGPRGDSLQALMAQHAPSWIYQLPWLIDRQAREHLRVELFGSTRERMLRELAVFLEVLPAPLVLVLEDLHWSDYATVDLIAHLAWRDEPARLLLLATVRPSELELAAHPLSKVRQELLLRGKCTELTPSLLDQAAVKQFLSRRFNDDAIAEQLAPLLHRLSGGQPLFLHNAVEHVIGAGQVQRDPAGEGWRLSEPLTDKSIGMPPSLQQLLDQELDRLSTEARRVLGGASVVGREFSAAAVASLLQCEVVEVEDCCELLVRQGQWLQDADSVVWPDGTAAEQYRFFHQLYRQRCYEALSAGRRQRYHRQMTECLLAAYAGQLREIAAELAYHYEQSHDLVAAVDYLGQAAEVDANRFAPSEATQKLDHALELLAHLGDDNFALHAALLRRRCELHLAGAQVHKALTGYQGLAQLAKDHADAKIETEALLGQGNALFWIDRERCLDIAELALTRSRQQSDGLLQAHASGWCAHWQAVIRGYEDHHDAAYEQAVTVARDAGAEHLQCQHLALHPYLLTLRSRYEQACDTASEGLALAERLGDGPRYLACQFFRAWALYYCGRWAEMSAAMADGSTMATKNGHLLWLAHFRLQQAWLSAHAGDFVAARAVCEPMLESVRARGLFGSEYFLGLVLLARAWLGSGEAERARRCLDEIEQHIKEAPHAIDWVLRLQLQLTLGEYWMHCGDWRQAQDAVGALATQAAKPMERTHYGLAQALRVEIALRQHDRQAAERALADAEQALDGFLAPLAAWRIYRAGGIYYDLLNDPLRAKEYWLKSVTVVGDLAASVLAAGDRSLHAKFVEQPVLQGVLAHSA